MGALNNLRDPKTPRSLSLLRRSFPHYEVSRQDLFLPFLLITTAHPPRPPLPLPSPRVRCRRLLRLAPLSSFTRVLYTAFTLEEARRLICTRR